MWNYIVSAVGSCVFKFIYDFGKGFSIIGISEAAYIFCYEPYRVVNV